MRLAITMALAAVLAIPAIGSAGQTEQLSAQLRGADEVPGPGDPNGKGEAFLAAKVGKGKICWQVSTKKIAEPTAAHIHRGAEDEAGPIKVTLYDSPQPDPTAEGCARGLKNKLVRKIAQYPERFYVNVHNADYPDGAIRGQLGPAL
jgi:hypothetical protein